MKKKYNTNNKNLNFALILLLLGTYLNSTAVLSAGKEDYIGGLVKLGIGGCRDSQGYPGKYKLHRDVSLPECKNLCFGKAPCTAVEYNQKKNECEIHSTIITGLSKVKSGDTVCYVYQ